MNTPRIFGIDAPVNNCSLETMPRMAEAAEEGVEGYRGESLKR
jgi:hypothetical protein